jgi:hypothetical protein
MIILDELQSTLKRMELAANNSDNPAEKVMFDILKNNLYTILMQAKQLESSPEFIKVVKSEVKNNEQDIKE